jgi:hypothetical protein
MIAMQAIAAEAVLAPPGPDGPGMFRCAAPGIPGLARCIACTKRDAGPERLRPRLTAHPRKATGKRSAMKRATISR